MREILILANGERIIRQANVATQPMLPPPALELVPPMTRLSRSPLFAEERLARRAVAGERAHAGELTAGFVRGETCVLLNGRCEPTSKLTVRWNFRRLTWHACDSIAARTK
jgi:hypothetical protein